MSARFWLRQMVLNPPVDLGDGPEHWPRSEVWRTFRPIRYYRIAARELPCGCTRRWWGTVTLIRMDCYRHNSHWGVGHE